ncbi:hypothetical protein BKA62DRAFT_818037 [Auriculariales sp. MPI-PUGE-AT-0066]|nr:hypothetical protein BKA62DRAFT_818037 [Auriculariales sp. MPI-PUGE-AT-0066]
MRQHHLRRKNSTTRHATAWLRIRMLTATARSMIEQQHSFKHIMHCFPAFPNKQRLLCVKLVIYVKHTKPITVLRHVQLLVLVANELQYIPRCHTSHATRLLEQRMIISLCVASADSAVQGPATGFRDGTPAEPSQLDRMLLIMSNYRRNHQFRTNPDSAFDVIRICCFWEMKIRGTARLPEGAGGDETPCSLAWPKESTAYQNRRIWQPSSLERAHESIKHVKSAIIDSMRVWRWMAGGKKAWHRGRQRKRSDGSHGSPPELRQSKAHIYQQISSSWSHGHSSDEAWYSLSEMDMSLWLGRTSPRPTLDVSNPMGVENVTRDTATLRRISYVILLIDHSGPEMFITSVHMY